MIGVLAKDEPQVPLSSDQHLGPGIRRGYCRSNARRWRSRRGAWTGVFTIRMPTAVNTASKSQQFCDGLGVAVLHES